MSEAKKKHKKEQLSLKEQKVQAHTVFRLLLFSILSLFDARRIVDYLHGNENFQMPDIPVSLND
jgi:hypothetical protein